MNSPEQHQLFDCWTRDHGAILHHVAHGFAEGDDRQDLMQELLLAVWKAIPAFRLEAQPSTFIYRVTHNAAMTWQRTRRNYRRKVEQFGALAPVAEQSDRNSPSSASLFHLFTKRHTTWRFPGS